MPSPESFAEPPTGEALPLPPVETTRWSPRRKAAVVLAERRGTISREEAYQRYRLSAEEFSAWETALDRNGIAGLRSTRQQSYRRAALAPGKSPRYDAATPARQRVAVEAR